MIVFSFLGFHKIHVYENPDGYFAEPGTNSYVEGDAYNFIINGTIATAYFVFAALMAIIGFGSLFYRNTIPAEAPEKSLIHSQSHDV